VKLWAWSTNSIECTEPRVQLSLDGHISKGVWGASSAGTGLCAYILLKCYNKFMINQQILDYIKQQVQQGVSREQIKSSLMTNGWQASDIEEGFNAIGSGSSNIPLAPLANVGPTSNFTNSVTPISYAGFWLRVAASLVDGFIVNLIFALLGFLYFWFFAKNNPSLSNSTSTVMGILYFIMWILYFPFMESRGGTTFGKKIVGIKVLNANGESVGFLRSLGRNLAKIISALILMIGFIMAGFTKKKQGLHDIIASCVVVRTRETSAGKIWAVIILIIVVCIGTVVIAGAQFLFMLSSLFSGGINIQTSSDQTPTTQTQNNGTGFTTSSASAFVPLSREEYDTYFSKPITGLDSERDYNGPHTYAGPALIAFDDFWGLNTALPVIPNLESNYVWIDLTSIISKNGQDILDRESTFEKDIFFKGLNLSKETQPFEFLSDHRSIHLITGAKSSDAKTVKGTLFFKIPLDSKNSSNFYEKSYPFTINI